MKRKKLFGNHIACSCSYCANSRLSGDHVVCKKNKTQKSNGSCRHFSYDPLKRVPNALPKLPDYTPEDFSLW